MAHTDIWPDFKPGYKFVCKYMSYWTTLIIFTDYSLFKLGDIHTHSGTTARYVVRNQEVV